MKIKMWKKYILAGIVMVCLIATLTACATGDDGNKDNPVTSEVVEQTEVEETEEANKPEETTEVVEESTEEVEPSTEVAVESQVSTEDLSIEEWLASLTFDKPTLLLINETTGDKKILEEGGEYKVVEGDLLVLGFEKTEYKMTYCDFALLDSRDWICDYITFSIVLEQVSEKTEVSVIYKNKTTDENVTNTVYFSK